MDVLVLFKLLHLATTTGIGVPDPFHGSGGKNDSTASSEGMVREVEDVAILLSNLYKRLHRSDDSLGDWEAVSIQRGTQICWIGIELC